MENKYDWMIKQHRDDRVYEVRSAFNPGTFYRTAQGAIVEYKRCASKYPQLDYRIEIHSLND